MGNAVYDNFEDKFNRWPSAEKLVAEIASGFKNGRDPWDSRWDPTDADIDALINAWVPNHIAVCQIREMAEGVSCPGPKDCDRRCGAGYWRQHGEDVAQSMENLARVLKLEDRMVKLWHNAGRVHDIDYPRFPHHDSIIPSSVAHPLGIATYLHTAGAAPAMVLAILNHAPHLRLRPASPLAWALLACDEHATITGYAGHDPTLAPTYPTELASLVAALRPSVSKIRGGFRRDDMQDRADLGLTMLHGFIEGKIPLFDSNRFADRINWADEISRVLRR